MPICREDLVPGLQVERWELREFQPATKPSRRLRCGTKSRIEALRWWYRTRARCREDKALMYYTIHTTGLKKLTVRADKLTFTAGMVLLFRGEEIVAGFTPANIIGIIADPSENDTDDIVG